MTWAQIRWYLRALPGKRSGAMHVQKISVTTWRDGVLARLGHDLEIEWGAASCEVICTEPKAADLKFNVPTGNVAKIASRKPSLLSKPLTSSDVDEIRTRIATTLKADTHPTLFVEVKGVPAAPPWPASLQVPLQVSIAGQTQSISAQFKSQSGRGWVNFSIDMRAFQLPPVTALMGAIKLKPTVDVVVEVVLGGSLL